MPKFHVVFTRTEGWGATVEAPSKEEAERMLHSNEWEPTPLDAQLHFDMDIQDLYEITD